MKLSLRFLFALGLSFVCGCASQNPPAGRVDSTKEASPGVSAQTASAPDKPTDERQRILAKLAAQPLREVPGTGWKSMFDGETLKGWKETPFAGRGEIEVIEGLLVLNMGDPFTGLNWTNTPPAGAYEISLEAMRYMGSDFFCGLTVPVRDTNCTLIAGGWGGGLVGISSLNGFDASENETTTFMQVQEKRWYSIRLRIKPNRIQAWIDGEKQIDADTTDVRISLRLGDIERSVPLGIACWQTTAVLRAIQWRPLTEAEITGK